MAGLRVIATAAVALASAGLLAGMSAWQDVGQDEREFQGLERLDQGFEDVGPLQTSLRRINVDLRQPTAFADVFRLQSGRLGRINGALTAEFDRSQYVATPNGTRPTIPPGTVFRIGRSAEELGLLRFGGTTIDRRAHRTVAEPITVGPMVQRSVSIWTDESFRQQRLAVLVLGRPLTD
ncbi:MAG: hypothetical protein AAF747_06770 [Planctomycetota bacterium]